MLVDFQNTVNAVKNKELAKYEKYYYMFFVGTVPEAQGKGLCLYLCKPLISLLCDNAYS